MFVMGFFLVFFFRCRKFRVVKRMDSFLMMILGSRMIICNDVYYSLIIIVIVSGVLRDLEGWEYFLWEFFYFQKICRINRRCGIKLKNKWFIIGLYFIIFYWFEIEWERFVFLCQDWFWDKFYYYLLRCFVRVRFFFSCFF